MPTPLEILQDSQLQQIRIASRDCTKCKLHDGRTQVVFGAGKTTSPSIMFIGEGPGRDEDFEGEPFVGQAGKLLDRILTRMSIPRESVFIDNIVKCRPPNNRKPEPDECKACTPYLKDEIDIIKPKVIVCLGATAAENLLDVNKPIKQLRVGWHLYKGIPVKVTYHPAWLLRMGDGTEDFVKNARLIWEDMEEVLEKLSSS